MTKSHTNRTDENLGVQENFERVMKRIEPFIPRPKKPKLHPPEVWRRGEDMPEDYKGRFWTEHHVTRSSRES